MKFTRLENDVANVTGLMRLKRIGKIRLGIKKKHAQTGREYPSATDHEGNPIDYFVIPQEHQEILGPRPKVIHGMFSSNDPHEVYQEELAMYGASSGLKCHGNGKEAERRDDHGEWGETELPL